jgi:DNA-binding cell septation regulator SpoVG
METITSIAVERMYKLKEKSGKGLKAFADVRFFNQLTVKGFRVVEKDDGTLFIGCPQTKNVKSNKWFNDVTLEKHLNIAVEDAVIRSYKGEAVPEAQTVAMQGRR